MFSKKPDTRSCANTYHNDVGGQIDKLGETIYFTLHPDQKQEATKLQYLGEYIKELSQAVKEDLQDKDQDLSQEKLLMKQAGWQLS